MVFSKSLHQFQNKTFTFVMILSWVLYILFAFGLSSSAPIYLNDLQYYIKIYVSLFLILRFNPFRRVKFTELDRKIVFASGIFLLGTTAISSFLTSYILNIKSSIYKKPTRY